MQTYKITITDRGFQREFIERASRLGVAVDAAVDQYAQYAFGMKRIPSDVRTTLTITVVRVG